MTANIWVKKLAADHYQWWPETLGQDQIQEGSGSELKQSMAETDSSHCIFLANAEQFPMRGMAHQQGEEKLLRKTLPYELEEDLLTEIDDLHFAIGPSEDMQVPLVIVEKQYFKNQLDELNNEGIEAFKVLPELGMLPWLEKQWTLLIDGDRSLVRYAKHDGLSIEQNFLPVTLNALLADVEKPESIVLYCDAAQRETIVAQLPESLRSLVLWQQGDYWSVIGGVKNEAHPMDLLQGDFARALPWKKWWSQWKVVAVFAAVALLVHLVGLFFEVKQLKAENKDYRVAIENVYRQVVPKGAIMDPERQLRKKVNSMKGGSDQSFTAMLDTVSKVLASMGTVDLQLVNYSSKGSEMRITLLTSSFNEVDTIRQNLEAKGIRAELAGSTNDGGKTRARLKLKGAN